MEKNERPVHAPFRQPPARIDLTRLKPDYKKWMYRVVTFGALIFFWHLAALHYGNQLVLPTPVSTFKALVFAVQDAKILSNLALTLKRVVTGLSFSLGIGLVLGFTMGYSDVVNKLVDPVIGPLRQVPVMAWVPLTIVWFGLGDGPTLFLIALVGVFPVLLNTMAGVRSVPKNYYHAARSMGAGRLTIFSKVTFPSALPDMITGLRLALSAGWMSVI